MAKMDNPPNGGNKVEGKGDGGKVHYVSNQGTGGTNTSPAPNKSKTKIWKILKGKK